MRTRTLKSVLAGGVCALALTTVAHAESREFAVPAGELSQALDLYIRQSGEQLIYRVADVRGMRTSGVSGELSSEDALARLLEGTSLTVKRDPSGLIAVASAETPAPQSESAAGDGAEGTVDALIVTAQKREEDIQDVPIAISAFTQEDLTRSQVAGGPDLMTQVPNFTFTKTNFSGYSIQIRGIGTQAISATTDPAVAIAFNNTPFIRNRFFEQEFYDLQRVEVLRGPQGTLYGRNATAGVVNILSAKPKFNFETKLSGDISNYNSTRLEGMINIPLVEDTVALRLAGAWTKRDGYVKNLLTGEQTDGRDLWSSRLSLRATPTDWLDVNLIWEHFEENDDRLRTGKQVCKSDPGPATVNGIPVLQTAAPIQQELTASYVSQGCLPASIYSPDSFETPNGYALAYYGALGLVGSPVFMNMNPYSNTVQSRNLREIETHLTPEYTAETDLVELQVHVDLPWNLSLSSETGYLKDFIFSFSDYNRFDTTPGVFTPGGATHTHSPEDLEQPGPYPDVVSLDGYFCDPQLGCTNRLSAGDLSTAKSQQFSQEFRLSSNFDGPFNFNLGANFLRYDTEEKYYVFINTLTAFQAIWTNWNGAGPWTPGVSDNSECLDPVTFYGRPISSLTDHYNAISCAYVDPNNIHNLNDQGRNYFLSKNPYHLISYAAFGEAYYNITPQLKVTGGLRWTVDKKTAPVIPSWLLAGENRAGNGSGASYGAPVYKVIELEWQEPTGRIAVDWKPDIAASDETLIYGSYVRGYKAGGANPPPPVLVLATACPPECGGFGNPTEGKLAQHYLTHPETFDAEYVDAFEIGTKNSFFEGSVTANVAAFYYDYKNYQISQITERAAINYNFDSTVWGAEIELDWRPLENFRLGFKGGYEQTKVADGERAIDTMDRVNGEEGYMLFRPFPTLPANCVVPTWSATVVAGLGMCAAYLLGVDPITYLPYVPNPTVTEALIIPEGYPGFDPTQANHGQGFPKDLSGNELPNAPDFTATITADYTLPLPNEWLMTLHTDLYYQSEAWTRIFNVEGYDKLKAYTNINLAAIFTNEDAGWHVMAYVKNVLDKDNITGAFLNSDDTGLTTNIFLNEPRLYGLRVTKEWTGGPLLGTFGARRDGPYPLTVEVGGQMQRHDVPDPGLIPFEDAFAGAFDPREVQREDLDWADGGEARVTWRPNGSAWKIAGGLRYGRTSDSSGARRLDQVTGDAICQFPTNPKYSPNLPGVDLAFLGKLQCDPEYGPVTKEIFGTPKYFENRYDPSYLKQATNRLSYAAERREEHMVADFMVGRDVGLGSLAEESALSAGIRYAEFDSQVSGNLRAVTNMVLPEDAWSKYDTTFDHYMSTFDGDRSFDGLGPVVSWEASRALWEGQGGGRLELDWMLAGGALFGKQRVAIGGEAGSEYFEGPYPSNPANWVVNGLPPPPMEPLKITRSESATVPVLDLSLGLSFVAPGVRLSTGYRWERYFDVIDGGFDEAATFDRTIDGPFIKVAIGLGG